MAAGLNILMKNVQVHSEYSYVYSYTVYTHTHTGSALFSRWPRFSWIYTALALDGLSSL